MTETNELLDIVDFSEVLEEKSVPLGMDFMQED